MTNEKQERPRFVLEVQSARHVMPTRLVVQKLTDQMKKKLEKLEKVEEDENGKSNS